MPFIKKYKYFTKTIIEAILLFLFISSIIWGQDSAWTKKADLPKARGYLSTSVAGGKIYAIGGAFNASTGSSDVEEYDPETDSWKTKQDLPGTRSGLSTSQVNGKIYAIGGGISPTGSIYPSTFEYNPKTNNWTMKKNMLTKRIVLSACVLNGKIYAIGGASSTNNYPALNNVEMYDPKTDTWTSKASMTTARGFLSTAVLGGKIYAIGGSSSQYGPVLKTVEEYDPNTDTWKQKADMNTARGWHTASVVDGKIYVIGGASDSDTDPNISSIEVYDPDTDTWTIVGEMVTVRRMFSASVVYGNIYTIGGITDGWSNRANASAKVEVFNPGINITDISEINTEIKEFSLHQNYPNPFNPTTTIKYSIPKQSCVTLIVYNILGKEITTLVNEEKSSGNYQVKFSAYGGNAADLPSGVYFYRIQAGSFNQVRKMILIK